MRTKLTAAIVIFLMMGATPTMAKPYELKCTTDRGEPAADLTVDIDNMVMTWGTALPNYTITKITDRYITAIENQHVVQTDVGSEIFVFDRVTGVYKRAAIAMFCNDSTCKTGSHLEVGTYFGKCVRPML
jgi:hypothetical protein